MYSQTELNISFAYHDWLKIKQQISKTTQNSNLNFYQELNAIDQKIKIHFEFTDFSIESQLASIQPIIESLNNFALYSMNLNAHKKLL